MKGMREGVSVPAWRPKGWVCPPLETAEAFMARLAEHRSTTETTDALHDSLVAVLAEARP